MTDQHQDDGVDDQFASFDDELESAYREVLEKMDEAEWQIAQAFEDLRSPPPEPDNLTADTEQAIDTSSPADREELDRDSPTSLEESAAALLAEFDSPTGHRSDSDQRVHPRQIVEAVLFVGGQMLTAKRICSVLKREFDHEYVDRRIAELNEKYRSQNRPYEIRFGEGGYRMELRPEFDAVRNRVFGFGPREVKLSQEALEILAQVAYRQPVTRAGIEEAGKLNPGSVLRQLLRRDLIELERDQESQEVRYRTTDRFLELFGLTSLEELPIAEDLNFK